VTYRYVYPGIDLAYYGNQGRLEYDWVVRPGADAGGVRLAVGGPGGVRLDRQRDLLLGGKGALLRQPAPAIYQTVRGTRHTVAGRYTLLGRGQVGFAVRGYDRGVPLVIDPVLVYNTYLGGSGGENYGGIAVDGAGDAYATGAVAAASFPSTLPTAQIGPGGSDAFVAELNPTGTALLCTTYLGGSGQDDGRSIAVDASGDAYVTGATNSTDFPTTTGSFRGASGGGFDAFVAKLNPAGSGRLYATYVGGSGDDTGQGIAVDGGGDAYVAGSTTSADFPVAGSSFGSSAHGESDAFVAKLNPAGSDRIYAAYLGGSGNDFGQGIAVDGAGEAFITGSTLSLNFPTTPGASLTSVSGYDNTFVVKMNIAGSAPAYATYLGGNADEVGAAIALDGSLDAYVTGFVYDSSYYFGGYAKRVGAATSPSTNKTSTNKIGQQGFYDAFVAKLGPTGSDLCRRASDVPCLGSK